MKRTPTQVLEEKDACCAGIDWVAKQDQSNPGKIFDDSLLHENELSPIGFYCAHYGVPNGMSCVCWGNDLTPEARTKLRDAFIADCNKEIE